MFQDKPNDRLLRRNNILKDWNCWKDMFNRTLIHSCSNYQISTGTHLHLSKIQRIPGPDLSTAWERLYV